MKCLVVILGLITVLSSHAQNIVTAEKNSDGADICFYKQVRLKGYAYANIIGRCAFDPALNGMNLILVAVSDNPMEDAHTVALDYIREVKVIQNKSQQLQITVIQDTFDADQNVIQKSKVIYVRVVDAKKGEFSLKL